MPNNVTQRSPETDSDTVQAIRTMTIEIKAQETEDLKLALEAVMRLVSSGFTSGFDRNESGSYRLSID